MPPRLVTQSAMVSAPISDAARAMARPSCQAPVEVSAFTNATTSGRSRWMKPAASSSEKTWPQGFAKRSRRAPRRRPISHRRSPKMPLTKTRAGRDEVHHRRLHAGGAGAGNHEGEFVLRAPAQLQQAADVGEDFEQIRVEVADDGLAERGVDARMDGRWSGAQQEPGGRMDDGCRRSHFPFSLCLKRGLKQSLARLFF